MPRVLRFGKKERHAVKNYEPVGIAMPPKTRINIQNYYSGIITETSKRKIARTTIAINAIINKVRDDP